MPKEKSLPSSRKARGAKSAPKAASKARGSKLAPAKVAVQRAAARHDEQEPAAALPSSARKPAKGPAISAPVEEPKKAPPPFKAGGDRRPTTEQMHAMPVEEIWPHYRKAASQRPRDEDWVKKIRNVLMELHYPLVKHIAERLLQTLPKSIELDDLVSAGLFGLMDAIRGFDPDRGIKFKTYCTTRIRGSILDQLRSQDWVPRLVRLKAGRIEKALQRLQGEYGREPTHAELANALRMEHGELANEMSSAHAKTMFSLSDRWDDRDDDNSMEKVEIVEDQKAVDPIAEINRRDVMKYITKSLTHKERFIIEQYYHVGHTMREIGEMLALTESRVCQIHSNVMSRLKGLLTPSSNSLEA
jgi:RNA polymerase sigma factor for flagellar operon FliA